MSDKPILFSAPMVRALLAGTKTQTRRIISQQPKPFAVDDAGTPCEVAAIHVEGDRLPRIRLGNVITAQELRIAVGDRLWVREAWRLGYEFEVPVLYEADAPHSMPWAGRLRQGMHMPRRASRLTLTVTDVRVQRLQEISEDDAKAEGWGGYMDSATDDAAGNGSRTWFRKLWDNLNASRGFGWDANPWVAAYTFTVEHANIDQLARAAA